MADRVESGGTRFPLLLQNDVVGVGWMASMPAALRLLWGIRIGRYGSDMDVFIIDAWIYAGDEALLVHENVAARGALYHHSRTRGMYSFTARTHDDLRGSSIIALVLLLLRPAFCSSHISRHFSLVPLDSKAWLATFHGQVDCLRGSCRRSASKCTLGQRWNGTNRYLHIVRIGIIYVSGKKQQCRRHCLAMNGLL